MSFRLSKAARKYFTELEKSTSGKLEHTWDKYYFCLMAGLTEIKLGDEPPADDEFVKEFPLVYHEHRYQILGVLITSELLRRGVELGNAQELQRISLELTTPTSPTFLSAAGMKRLNEYADGRFRVLQDRIPEHRELSIFLKEYYEQFMKRGAEPTAQLAGGL
jgi:hypothetical protein